MDTVRDRLESDLARVGWRDLRSHAGRGALFVVESGLAVLDVGLAVATDDAAAVTRWLDAGQLRRPTVEELQAWESTLDRQFDSLIVQPYVLAQHTEH